MFWNRKAPNAESLFHEMMSQGMSMDEALSKCRTKREASSLLMMLVDNGELDRNKYDSVLESVSDRFLF